MRHGSVPALTAREGGLWADRLRQEINSTPGHCSGRPRQCVLDHQARRGWHQLAESGFPFIPPLTVFVRMTSRQRATVIVIPAL